MLNCPDGHPNPAGWEFCGECGTPLEEAPSTSAWYRTKWAIVGAIVLAALVIVGGAVTFVLTTGSDQSGSSAPASAGSTAIQEWWAGAHEDVTALQTALDDAQRALDHADGPGLEAACQQMHDAAEVKLQSHMPTPDPELTSELAAAAEDAHTAAHMVLAVAAGSINVYDGEFVANLDQAERHLTAAQELVNKALTAGA